MSFQLSTDVDKNKIFLINCSSLNERLDPEYYQPNHYQDLILLKNSPYRNDVLDHVCSRIVDGPFGSSIKASDYVESGIPFIRVADVTRGEGSIKIDDLIFISEEAHERIVRSKVIPSDVVIAKTGATMGAASLVPDSIPEANIRGDLAALSVNENHCISRYVVVYINTNIGQRLFWRLDSGGTRGRVVIGNLKKYPIVVPPIEIQQKIIEKMDAGYALQKRKDLEAQRSLDSIDDYLLGELGINLVEPEENTIQNRVFHRNFSELTGQRFDSYYYKTIFENTKESVLESKYPVHKLRNLSSNIQNGVEIRDYSDSGFRYLRVTDLGKYEINNNSPRYVDVDEIPSRVILNEKCLLVSRSGSLGLVSKVVPEIENAILSSHILKVELNTDIIIPEYAEAFLRSRVGQIEIFKENNGGVIPEINQTALGKILIPCPPINKQLEIVEHIDAIRDRAKQLRQEATADLEKAKQEVEAMILGVE